MFAGKSPLRRVFSGNAQRCKIALDESVSTAPQLTDPTPMSKAVSLPQASWEKGGLFDEPQDEFPTLGSNWTITSIFEERENEVELDCSGELTCFEPEDETRALSGVLSIAESIKPKDTVSMLSRLDCDGAHLGFWADVGASTFGLLPDEGATSISCDFSDWDSEEEEEEVVADAGLLPWDF